MTTGGRIQYALLMGACRITGMFPNRLLYHALAPFICFVLHRIVRYRLTVVRTNLSNSFPEKSAAELREIETKFYRHLSEVFVDTIKLATISRKEILERMVYRDVEAQEEAMRGRNWISAMSHYGSWELTINYACHSDHRVLAVYRPLHSEAFDLFYHKARSRFGTQPVPMNNILQETLKSKPAWCAMRLNTPPMSKSICWQKHWKSTVSRWITTRHSFVQTLISTACWRRSPVTQSSWRSTLPCSTGLLPHAQRLPIRHCTNITTLVINSILRSLMRSAVMILTKPIVRCNRISTASLLPGTLSVRPPTKRNNATLVKQIAL